MLTRFRPALLVRLVVVALMFAANAAAADRPSFTNRLVVKFATPADDGLKAAASEDRSERLGRRAGIALRAAHVTADNAQVFYLPGWVSVDRAAAAAARLAAEPDIEYAVPDRLRRPMLVPNDSFYPQQWNLYEDAGGLRLPDAWDVERGDPAVVIALLDGGTVPHVDLDPIRQVPGYDFISDPLLANDGDGRDPDPADPGDWVSAGECDENSPAEDSSWHGTQIAGATAATTDNGTGIAGVNHGSSLLIARVLGKCGGFTSDIADAMRWAAGIRVAGVPDNARPARVINLSFGGEGPCTFLEQAAIDAVIARGAVVVVAAGNESGDVANLSPANCRGVLAVAATNRSGGRATYTNTGEAVDVSAPGGDITDPIELIRSISNAGVTLPAGDDYAWLAGTSVASAQVSGVAALLLSVNANLSSQQVMDILVQSARPFTDPSCTPLSCGSGIVDAAAAVRQAAATQGQPDSDNDGINDAIDLCLGTPAGEPVNANGCSASQLTGGGGGGGGGCSLALAAAIDPLFPLLLLFAALHLARQSGQSRATRPG